jgi:RNA polymerase sigma factor (sigma-70 family)
LTSDSAVIADSIDSPASFALVFNRHYDPIHGYLQRRVGRDLADELTAQTFLIAFDQRSRFDTARPSARPWLFGISTNLLRRHRRQERRQLQAYVRTGIDPIADAFQGVEVRLDAARMGRELAGSLTRLSPEELDVLLLYAWAELSYAEIAQTLDIPVGTVRSRLSRARGRVRELLEPERASTECKHSEKTEADDGRD